MKIRLPRKEKPPVEDPDSYLKTEVEGDALKIGQDGSIAIDSEEDISKSQKKYMAKKEIWMYAFSRRTRHDLCYYVFLHFRVLS